MDIDRGRGDVLFVPGSQAEENHSAMSFANQNTASPKTLKVQLARIPCSRQFLVTMNGTRWPKSGRPVSLSTVLAALRKAVVRRVDGALAPAAPAPATPPPHRRLAQGVGGAGGTGGASSSSTPS